jgi:hypothetical protein
MAQNNPKSDGEHIPIESEQRVISSYFFSTPSQSQKRPLSSSSSVSTNPSPSILQIQKKPLLDLSDISGESMEKDEIVGIKEALDSIKITLDGVATKQDIGLIRKDFEKFVQKTEDRFEKLEGRFFDLDVKVDKMGDEIKALHKENEILKSKLHKQEQKVISVSSQQNDLEQYDRRWNVRVYGVKEKGDETAQDCARAVCGIFNDQIGVSVSDDELEAVHRTGPKPPKGVRPIIVRFRSRKQRDSVLADRKKLKGTKVSIDEDLTSANYKLCRAAYKHTKTLSTWSSNGKVLAKLKNGKTLRIPYGADLDALFDKEMP